MIERGGLEASASQSKRPDSDSGEFGSTHIQSRIVGVTNLPPLQFAVGALRLSTNLHRGIMFGLDEGRIPPSLAHT